MIRKKAITRTTAIVAIIIIIVVAAVAIYYLTLPPSEGQPQIKGIVTDEETGDPVEGAKVTADGYETFTDSDGVYLINVTVGTYTVKVEKEGYVTKTATADVTAKKAYTVDFVVKVTLVRVRLDPSEIALNVSEVSVGDRFNVTAWVSTVEDLFAYQVALYYNASVINITDCWQPTWNSSYVFYGQTGTGNTSYDSFDSWGESLVGSSLLSGETSFTGDGLLAVFEFEIVASPTVDLTSDLIISSVPSGIPPEHAFETKLKDSTGAVIDFTAIDGHYEYTQ